MTGLRTTAATVTGKVKATVDGVTAAANQAVDNAKSTAAQYCKGKRQPGGR
jgi:hypothetical protein